MEQKSRRILHMYNGESLQGIGKEKNTNTYCDQQTETKDSNYVAGGFKCTQNSYEEQYEILLPTFSGHWNLQQMCSFSFSEQEAGNWG